MAVIRTGGLSPFERIEYRVVLRQGTAVAWHVRALAGAPVRQKMKMLPSETWQRLWNALRPALAAAPPPPQASHAAAWEPRWQVEFDPGGKARPVRWKLAGVAGALPSPWGEAIRAFCKGVQEATGSIRFYNAWFEPGQRGWLDLETVPPAKVFIDGEDIGEETPLYAWPLAAGKHRVRLVAERDGIDRDIEVTIAAGMTTIVRLRLP